MAERDGKEAPPQAAEVPRPAASLGVKSYTLKTPSAAGNFRRRFAGELNPQQLDVATAPDGPCLVLAGAGSGKTRAVTYRVAYLIDRGVDPDGIVLLTFTNKAAREMLRRVEALLPIDPKRLWGGTFHRVANLILRKHAHRLGYGPSYTILDSEDSRELLDAAIAESDVDPKEQRFPKGDVLHSALSLAINTQKDLSRVLVERWPFFADLMPAISAVVKRYMAKKRERNAMDYDDLLLNLLTLLRDEDAVREEYARRFRHVLVDEYQDTNHLQAGIVDLLASGHKNVMAVGDDAQSIYSFRGAAYDNILGFPERYPGVRVLKLEINYRSTPEILSLANQAIAHNPRQHPKELKAVRPPGPRPALVSLRDAQQQAQFVASRILELRDEGVPLDRIGVLYRSHWHSAEVQMELARRRIPFEVRSGVRFFESAHVKDVLAHLRVVANPLDEVSWRRILRLLPRVGNKTAEKLYVVLASKSDPLLALARGELDGHVPKGAKEGFGELRDLLGGMAAPPGPPAASPLGSGPELRVRPTDLIRRVLMGPYSTYLYRTYDDAENRLEDLNQLALFALSFESLDAFLTDLALSSNLEAEALAMAGEDDEPKLVLTSVHQAKGLEWRAVFLVWLVDGRFPSSRSLKEDGGEEEERRIFYVAVTRAEDELYLCHPQVGRDEYRQDVFLKPSRFVQELSPESYERWQVNEEVVDEDDGADRVREGPADRDLFDDGPFSEE